MRPSALCLALLLCAGAAAAQVPERMVFGGRLVRSDGQPEATAQTLRFAIYDAATGGAKVWEEVHASVPLSSGYYSVVLGEANPLSNVFTGEQRYLSVSLANQSEMLPRLPVSTVPYSFLSADSARVGGQLPSAFATADHGHSTATTASAGFLSGGDKGKLDQVPTVWGNGLTHTATSGTVQLEVAFAGSGSAVTAARSDHSHALPKLSCTTRSNTAAFNTGALAACQAGEVLTGGGCEELPSGSGFTTTAAPTASGYACRGGGSTPPATPVTARAICCRVVP